MDLAPTGRLIFWLGLGLLIVGFFFSSIPILLAGALLILYLLLEGISFHRAVDTAKDLIKLESRPTRIETTAGRQVRIENFIANHSRSSFHIIGFSRNVPPQIGEEARSVLRLTLSTNGVQRIETLLKPFLPGYFELTTSTISLEGRAGLFKQEVRIRDKVTMIAKPSIKRSVDSIDVGVLADLAVDHLRRGSGTDLAGIRPFMVSDNFRSIDWKATARTGELMIRESYLEREPTVVLMIDVSYFSTVGWGVEVLSLFSGVANLLTAFRPATPVGLILHDKLRVIANIEAGQGVTSRERIQSTILEKVIPTLAPGPLGRRAILPNADLARKSALPKESALLSRNVGPWERFSSFASLILPFYERARSKYFDRVRGQGVFKAFETVCTFPEPVLLIVFPDDESNLDGLTEGVKNVMILNHKVVLAILSQLEPSKRNEILSDLEGKGVGVLRCRPEDLPRVIGAEIRRLSHSRTIPVSQLVHGG